ncbi:MAG: DNA translocase FtsK [Candidatus Omnitrophica bacterium]|nr:DNA translocase FtsK [Candidatus Omnitrophota bacterium]
MKSEHINEIKGILLFAFALILFASLISYTPDDLIWFSSHPNYPAKNLISVVGAYTAGAFLVTFGYSAYFLVVFLLFWSWNIFTSRSMFFTAARVTSLLVLLSDMSGLFSLMGSPIMANRFSRGGMVGLVFSDFLVNYLGGIGAFIILFTVAALCLVLTAEFLVSPFLVKVTRGLIGMWQDWREGNLDLFARMFKAGLKPKLKLPGLPKKNNEDAEKEDDDEKPKRGKGKKGDDPVEVVIPVKPQPPKAPNIKIIKPVEEPPKEREDKPLVLGDYQFPPFDLLNDPPKVTETNVQETLVSGAKTLEQTLAQFGISVRVADIERGPVITKYELEPAAGVRVQQITTLADDIALAMQASSVRIQAPIPGKNRVGIEVPNGAAVSVYLKDVLIQGDIRNQKSKLTLALGKDTAGKPILANLADMPHLLVAGATGSGKTVALNAIITSILYNAAPNEVKFIMIDPKMVELVQYNDIPHMLCPAITDHKKVAAALGWVVAEMETRYKTLAKHQVRNIAAYHAKGFEMPFIVVVVDEFADLMQTSGKLVESAVVRLAQLARAVGIHLILATQRPSVNVITGVIKANLPARIAFRVNSQVDSRTILDEKGADDLIGRGDMLFMKPGEPKPIRGQCSFLSDDEIHRVMDFIRKQAKPEYDETVTAKPAVASGSDAGEKDEMYEEAVKVVMETGQASVSVLQRRLSLGYARAGKLIDAMDRAGLVGPYCGSKAREILVDREKWLVEHMGGDVKAVVEAEEDSKEKA